MNPKNKTQAVKQHLQSKSITSIQAINLYGATRLADIIYRLKEQGLDIITTDKTVIDRYGTKTIIGVYNLIK